MVSIVRESLNKFPHFFRMGTFIDSTHIVPFEVISSGWNVLAVPFQQLVEGPIEVLLSERVNDLRHSLFHVPNRLVTTASELREQPKITGSKVWKLTEGTTSVVNCKRVKNNLLLSPYSTGLRSMFGTSLDFHTRKSVPTWYNGYSARLRNCCKGVRNSVALLRPSSDKYFWESHDVITPLSMG